MFEQVIIVGRLGRAPEMRYTPAGQAVTNFSVAVDRNFTKADGTQVKETKWFRVETWGKMAEACNTYLDKGKLVMVEGRLKVDPVTGCPRIYEKDGAMKAANLEIVAGAVKFLSPRDNGTGEPEIAEEPEQAQEIPF